MNNNSQLSNSLTRSEIAVAAAAYAICTYLIWCVLEPWTRMEIWANFDNRNYHPDMIGFGMDRLLRGEWPFWNPYQAAGVPFFAALQGMVLYPTTWLGLIFSAETTHILGKYIHLAVSGLSIYFYLRVLKLHRVASFLGGLFYMTGNFYLCFTVFETGSYPMATVGILLGAVEKIFQTTSAASDTRANRWSLLFIVTLTFEVFAGYIQSVVFIGYFLCLYIPVRLAQSYWVNRSGQMLVYTFARFAVMAVLAVMLSSIQLLPTYEMSAHSATHNLLKGMELSFVNIAFLPPLSFLEALSDSVVPIPHTAWDMLFWAMVAWGLLCAKGNRLLVGFYLATALAFLTLARGSDNWLYNLYFYHVPTGNWFRWPEKFLLLSNLSISILVGLGLHHCHRWFAARRWAAVNYGLWWYCLAIFAVAFVSRYSTNGVQLSHPDWHWKAFGKTYAPYQFSSVLQNVEHLVRNPAQFRIHLQDPHAAAAGALDFLRQQEQQERTVSLLIVDWDYLPDLSVKWGMRERLYSIEDYEPLISGRYDGFLKAMGPSPFFHRGLPANLKKMSLFSTRWLLVSQHWIDRHPRLLPKDLERVYADEHFQIYRLPNFIPRSYVSDNVLSMPEAQILDYLSNERFDPSSQVVVGQMQATHGVAENRPIVSARIVDYRPEKVVVELPPEGVDGVLVLTDTYDTNWRVTVDGQPATMFPANYLFRGVEVTRENRRVVYSYHPVMFYWGAAISSAAIVLMLLFYLALRRRASAANKQAQATV
jgi:hypothetical protein